MEFENKIQDIKKALLQGGLVLAPRGSGKTTALAEILIEDEDAIVLVPHKALEENLVYLLVQKGLSRTTAQNKVSVMSGKTINLLKCKNKNIYVEEYFLYNREYNLPPFKAATGSLNFPVKVIK